MLISELANRAFLQHPCPYASMQHAPRDCAPAGAQRVPNVPFGLCLIVTSTNTTRYPHHRHNPCECGGCPGGPEPINTIANSPASTLLLAALFHSARLCVCLCTLSPCVCACPHTNHHTRCHPNRQIPNQKPLPLHAPPPAHPHPCAAAHTAPSAAVQAQPYAHSPPHISP